jgi:hypothetical protein
VKARIIGVDPGPTPGIVRLHVKDGRLVSRWTHVVQCSANVMPEIVGTFVDESSAIWPTTVAVERFVVRGRANAAQQVTRDQVGYLLSTHHTVERSASQVKGWATDERLEAAGLLEACKGMRHARDAARHALFAAVADGGLTDPLSKDWTR